MKTNITTKEQKVLNLMRRKDKYLVALKRMHTLKSLNNKNN
jgi:hypothetical protein